MTTDGTGAGPASQPAESLDIRGDVLVGLEGELFPAAGGGRGLHFARGGKLASATLLAHAANFARRRTMAENAGVKFMQFIAPEKYVVMAERFPIRNPGSMAAQYFEAGHADARYPVSTLQRVAGGPAYFRTDSHWAPAGLAAIAQEVAQLAGLDSQQIDATDAIVRAQVRETGEVFYGDLGRKLTPPEGERKIFLAPHPQAARFDNELGYAPGMRTDGLAVLVENPQALSHQKLLIFGDSHFYHAIDYLGYYFQTVLFLRTAFYHAEVVVAVRPDIVICQMAEHYMWQARSDMLAPEFHWLAPLHGRAPRFSPAAAKAFARIWAGGRDVDVDLFG